ncbi:MAG: hypothetical protein KQJ78_08070 [Deltaproteobacteria bacterium]|nr:hypothetical protein [Deltaproteobacteria bacterium]
MPVQFDPETATYYPVTYSGGDPYTQPPEKVWAEAPLYTTSAYPSVDYTPPPPMDAPADPPPSVVGLAEYMGTVVDRII